MSSRKERKEYQKRKEKNKEKKKDRKTTDKDEDDALAYLKKMQEASEKRLKETKPEAHAALQSIFKEAEEIAAETGADPAIQMLQTHFERRIRPRQIAREDDDYDPYLIIGVDPDDDDGKIKKSSKIISLKPKIFLEFDAILKFYANDILLNNK